MSDSAAFQQLLDAIVTMLTERVAFHESVQLVLNKVESLDWAKPETPLSARPVPHAAALASAIDNMRSCSDIHIAALGSAMNEAAHLLPWCVDNGHFYAAGTDIGTAYLETNMNCQLAGPTAAMLPTADFRLGFFFFGAKSLYRDHRHPACELYIPLTAPTLWRHDTKGWTEQVAGSVIFHQANRVHAMQTREVPFLALFAWYGAVHDICELVPVDDWAELETRIAASGEVQP